MATVVELPVRTALREPDWDGGEELPPVEPSVVGLLLLGAVGVAATVAGEAAALVLRALSPRGN